jgi:dipeptidyl aminopeptidase/acylaminoacyl peptidase
LLWDVARKIEQRLTADLSRNDSPVWSPDGRQIAFRSTRSGQQEIWLKAANGSGTDVMLSTDANTKFPSHWSRDGQFILYSDNAPATRIDLWYIPVEGDRTPVKFLQTPFNEAQGQLAPESRWMAYMSEKTGQREVDVAPFPTAEGETRISVAGGEQPIGQSGVTEECFDPGRPRSANDRARCDSPRPLEGGHLAGLVLLTIV